jgi:eukaryotic-like serine/threonine-protein kinase
MRDPAILQKIFHEALHRTGDERASYLNATCAGDPELLEEVESLLATATATETFTGEGDGVSPFALPDLVGSRYEIQGLIGRGGMGEVYRTHDRQLDRTVAIKAIRSNLASRPEFVHRLATEARLAASVDHPFICKVHELIQRDDGQVFFVMEYVEGQTLRTILKKGPLDLLTAVRLARELAEALRFAHERGLVHRDVKPGNVMVTSHGHVKVMDFGIAKTDRPEEPSAATRPGQILGTPAYMSPEQAAGGPVDHRSDIFSFGMVFYECLTGDLPFESLSTTDYRHQVAVTAPRPLPKRVPGRVRKLVARCLEKTPEKRYASLKPVQSELGTVLSVLSATHLSLWQRVRLAPRPWLVAGLLVAIAGVATLFIVDRIRADRPSQLLTQQPVVTWPSVEESSRVSPDGTTVAFVSNQGGPRLWIRLLAGSDPKPITAVRDVIKTPAWSPDGKQLAYLFRNEGRAWLQIISVWGEPAGAARPLGGAWEDVALVRWIGQRIYFSVASGTPSVLWRYDITRGIDEQVTHSSGKRFTTTGKTVNVDVRQDESRIVFVPPRPDEGLWTADIDGRNAERLPLVSGPILTPRWKGPAGRRVLYVTTENGQPDVWEYRLDTQKKAAVTTSPLEEETIDVSASGDFVVADTVEQIAHLWAVDPSGTSPAIQLTNDSRSDLWPSVTQSGRVIFHRRKGSFVTYATRDTELIEARWTDFRLVTGGVVGAGAAGAVSDDGRRVFFLRWTDTAQDFPELWVKELDSPRQPVRVWDRFWFPGNHRTTWAPLGQNATWAPGGSDGLYFVRRASGTDPTFEIVRATFDASLTATMQILAADRGDQRFLDLAVSDDGSLLAAVRTNRRLFRGGSVEVLDLRRSGSPPRVVFESAEGTQLAVKGWTRRGTIVVLRSFRPDVKNATEIWEIDPRGKPRLLATEVGLLAMTARLDSTRDVLFATSIKDDVSTVRSVSLANGGSKTVVANSFDGITFGGYALTADGWLLYMRKDTNQDVWAFSLSDHQAVSPSQGAKK